MSDAICGLTTHNKTFEAHITIEPVEGSRHELLEKLVKPYGFKVAKLYMIKDRRVTEKRSNKDSFCTGWGDDAGVLRTATVVLCDVLQENGFKVWRYKIEQTLEDVRFAEAD